MYAFKGFCARLISYTIVTLIFKIVKYLILDVVVKQNQFLIHPIFIQMSRKDQCEKSKHFCVKSFFLDSVEQEKLCLMIISGQLLFTHTKKIFEALYDVLPVLAHGCCIWLVMVISVYPLW